MNPTIKILGFVAAGGVAIVSVTAAVVLWTLQAWPTPIMPTLYLATALLVVFLVMGGGWFVVTRRELVEGIGAEGASAEERGLQRLIGLTAGVLLGLGALAMVGSWNVESVRARFVSNAASHVQLEKILGDSSQIVRLRACEELFQRGWVFRSEEALTAALEPAPAMATKCLQTAQEKDWKGFEMMAGKLGEAWLREMMHADAEGAAGACERAPWSPVMAELAKDRPELPLLQCALGAQSDDVRQCCATNLASRGPLLAQLGDAQGFPNDATEVLLPSLINHAFSPLSLTTGQQAVGQTLGLDDEAVRQWAVKLGCWAVDPAQAQVRMIGALYPLIEADTCGLSPEEEAEYQSPLAWGRLCQQIVEDTSGKPIQQVVCLGVQDTRIAKTIDNARIGLHHALRAPFLQKDADFLEAGLLSAQIMGGAEADERARRELEGGKTLLSDAWGYLPPGVRPDMTVGEYLAQHKATVAQRKRDIARPLESAKVQAAYKRGGEYEKPARARSQKDLTETMKTAHENR